MNLEEDCGVYEGRQNLGELVNLRELVELVEAREVSRAWKTLEGCGT
jgi:hypothetical protein